MQSVDTRCSFPIVCAMSIGAINLTAQFRLSIVVQPLTYMCERRVHWARRRVAANKLPLYASSRPCVSTAPAFGEAQQSIGMLMRMGVRVCVWRRLGGTRCPTNSATHGFLGAGPALERSGCGHRVRVGGALGHQHVAPRVALPSVRRWRRVRLRMRARITQGSPLVEGSSLVGSGWQPIGRKQLVARARRTPRSAEASAAGGRRVGHPWAGTGIGRHGGCLDCGSP